MWLRLSKCIFEEVATNLRPKLCLKMSHAKALTTVFTHCLNRY